jgi:hypothetical protein
MCTVVASKDSVNHEAQSSQKTFYNPCFRSACLARINGLSLENVPVVMSSAVQISPFRPAISGAHTSVNVDETMMEALRAIAPSIDPLMNHVQQPTHTTVILDAQQEVMAIQGAAAQARVALERQFPALKQRTGHSSTPGWAMEVHENLKALEERIRDGYLKQEDPVAVRDAVLDASSSGFPSALNVLKVIVTSSRKFNFDLSDPSKARALGIRSNLSALSA